MYNKTEYQKKYRLAHLEERKIYDAKYRAEHLEEGRERARQYSRTHKEEAKERAKEWNRTHPGRVVARAIKWNLSHPEQRKTITSRHRRTPRGRMTNQKHTSRWRKLGFVPLNEPFPDSRGHHIDTERVVYIPRELHESIPHSVLRNRNMERINEIAFKFIRIEEVR